MKRRGWLSSSADLSLDFFITAIRVFKYSSGVYLQLIRQHGVVRSMSRKGNCYDNAVAESFFSSLKNELIHHRLYQTREQARSEIFEYIELFYNRQRIHQSLNYQTPVKYEQIKRVA